MNLSPFDIASNRKHYICITYHLSYGRSACALCLNFEKKYFFQNTVSFLSTFSSLQFCTLFLFLLFFFNTHFFIQIVYSFFSPLFFSAFFIVIFFIYLPFRICILFIYSLFIHLFIYFTDCPFLLSFFLHPAHPYQFVFTSYYGYFFRKFIRCSEYSKYLFLERLSYSLQEETGFDIFFLFIRYFLLFFRFFRQGIIQHLPRISRL